MAQVNMSSVPREVAAGMPHEQLVPSHRLAVHRFRRHRLLEVIHVKHHHLRHLGVGVLDLVRLAMDRRLWRRDLAPAPSAVAVAWGEALLLPHRCRCRRVAVWKEVMDKGFARMDDEVTSWAKSRTGGELACRCELQTPARCDHVGSTAVVAVVGHNSVVVANSSDSCVVLCRASVPVPLFVDHKPDRADELERI